MKITLAFLLLISTCVQSQYYYKDILGTAETNNLIRLYTANKVEGVSLKSYEPDGSPVNGFAVEQTVESTHRILKTVTSSGITGQSVLNATFDENGKVTRTVDTTGTVVNTSVYTYDPNGRLASIKSFSGDSDTLHNGNETEEHLWNYNDKDQPIQMLRVINNTDTTAYKFVLDEQGNVSEERLYRNGKPGDPVYYYYNAQNKLTDIVRYNYKLKKLLPDYMFEYSDAGQVIQKITVPSNKGSEYLIWRYQYDSKGLKAREACYNKDRQLTGKIEYAYRYGR